jgi:hypothetical protein
MNPLGVPYYCRQPTSPGAWRALQKKHKNKSELQIHQVLCLITYYHETYFLVHQQQDDFPESRTHLSTLALCEKNTERPTLLDNRIASCHVGSATLRCNTNSKGEKTLPKQQWRRATSTKESFLDLDSRARYRFSSCSKNCQ